MNSLIPVLADVSVGSSNGLIQSLLVFLLIGICLAAIWYVGTWFLGKFGAPAIAATLWSAIFVILALVVFINFVMGLGGHSFLRW